MTEVLQNYMGSGLLLIWFLLSLIYLFFREEQKSRRIFFVYAPVILLLLFFNPLFYSLFHHTVGTEIYFRLCWLLPLTITLAYTIIHISKSLTGGKRIGFWIVAVCILMVSGKPVYSNPLYSPAENSYHVPQKVVDICDAIAIPGREVMAAFPQEFLLYVRQYSPLICMPYGREVFEGIHSDFYTLMNHEKISVQELSRLAKEFKCHYVILPEEKILSESMEDYGYELFDSLHGYLIYRDPSMNFNTFIDY